MSDGDKSERSASDLQASGTSQPPAPDNSSSNNPQFIGDLPQELFVKILKEIFLLRKGEGMSFGTDWTNPYQLVCCSWRDVIRSTPELWQETRATQSPEWLELCLTRCANTLVAVDVRASVCSSAAFATLCHHASSLKACYVHFDANDKVWLSGLSSLLATPMPALETLAMDGRYHQTVDLAEAITHDLVPRLNTLILHAALAPREVSVYESLRRLALNDTIWGGSYADFLDVMRKCRNLEYLHLGNRAFYFFEYDPKVLDPATKNRSPPIPVVLPQLRNLKLGGPSPVVFRLLAAIDAPQAVRVEFTNILDPDDDEFGPDVALLLAPNPQLRYPFLSSPNSIYLRCWDGAHFRLHIRCGPGRSLLYNLDRTVTYSESSWNPYLEQNLTAIMDIFSVASVETLEVEGRLDKVAADVWQRMFQAFSSLRTLHLRGQGTLDSFWVGLQRATLSSVEHGGGVCCPSLSEITTEARSGSRYQFAATTRVFELIREALGARSTHCDGPLEKLKLRLRYTNEVWHQTAELRDAFVEDVRALVRELQYHDGRTC